MSQSFNLLKFTHLASPSPSRSHVLLRTWRQTLTCPAIRSFITKSRHSYTVLFTSLGVNSIVASTFSTGCDLGGYQRAIRGHHTANSLLKKKIPGMISPEQQHMPLSPDSQVYQSIHREVLAPAQWLPKILKLGGDLWACDPLRVEKRRRERDGKEQRRE